jgi:apolipoprotein N-acyltransferase
MDKFTRNFRKTYGSAIFSGMLVALSFPRTDYYPLAWVALVPLLYSLYFLDKKNAFRFGFTFGIVYFFGTCYWIYYSINHYGSVPLFPSLLLVLVLCCYLSLYPAVFAMLFAVHMKKTDMPVMFVAPILWTSLEFLRSYALTGFPWSSLGYSQYSFLPAIQIADITGIYGVSFLIVAFNGVLADILLMKHRREERPLYSLLPTVTGFVLMALAVVFTFSYGFYRLHQDRDGPTVRVAVLQGNIEQDHKWDPAYQQSVISAYKELSIAAATQKPDLIVWPETALPFVFGKNEALTEDLKFFQAGLHSYLLTGTITEKEEDGLSGRAKNKRGPLKYSNSAVLLNAVGKVSYIYDKIHLVPFGEYVPLRKILFFVDKLAYGIGDYNPGTSYMRAVTPFGSFGTLICYEVIFPGLARKFFSKDGDFLITITNDAWFGKTCGPYQHFSMAVFRAVENRKPVIRAANSGISGFIDSRGRVLVKTDLFKRTFSVMDIKKDKTVTVYTKYGDIFSFLCIISSLLFLIKKYD